MGEPRVEERRGRHREPAGEHREQGGLDGGDADLLPTTESHRDEQVALVLADGADESAGQEGRREGQRRTEQQHHEDRRPGARPLSVQVRQRGGQVGPQPGEPGPVADPGRQQARRVGEQMLGPPQRGVVGQVERGVGGDAQRVDRRPAAEECLLVDDEGAVGRSGFEAVAVGGGEARTLERVAVPLQDGPRTEDADHHHPDDGVDPTEAALLAQLHPVTDLEPEHASRRVRYHGLRAAAGSRGRRGRRGPAAGRQVRPVRQGVGRHEVRLAAGTCSVRREPPQPRGDCGLPPRTHRGEHVVDHLRGRLLRRCGLATVEVDEEGRHPQLVGIGPLDRLAEGTVLRHVEHQRARPHQRARDRDQRDHGTQQPSLHDCSAQRQEEHPSASAVDPAVRDRHDPVGERQQHRVVRRHHGGDPLRLHDRAQQ